MQHWWDKTWTRNKKEREHSQLFSTCNPPIFQNTNWVILHQLLELTNLERGHSIKEVMPLNVFTRKKKHQEIPLIISFTAKHVR